MSCSIETAFLPGALEIQETSPSPVGRAILWTILGVVSLAVVWASLGEVDIVAIAHGRIIPSGHSKTVQPLDKGMVSAIHVREGQHIEAGKVLIELDASSVRADVARLETERTNLRREATRLTTLAGWLSGEIAPRLPEPDNAGEDALLLRQWHEFRDRLAVLEHERDQVAAQRRSVERRIDKLRAIQPIVTRQANDQKRLAEQQLIAEQQFLETEQRRLENHHDLQAQQERVRELDAEIEAVNARIAHSRSEFHRQLLERLDAAERRHAAAEQELLKAKARAKAQTITAPVDGVVQQLAIHHVGAIVTPAQELMVIVPQGGSLEVEAVLENKDIGFVGVGQPVEIKVDAFPFTQHGTIAGEVVDLSDDAVADERKGLVYRMRVLLQGSSLPVHGKPVTLSPGMTVTVEAKTGKRRLIEFFLSPLLRYRDESVRER